MGVPFDAVTQDQALAAVEGFILSGKPHHIVTPNPEMILEAQKNGPFKEILKKASLSLPDGIGVLWAAHYLSSPDRSWGRFFGTLFRIAFDPKSLRSPLPERVTGTDLMHKMIEASQTNKWRIFLLGARPGVAQKAMNHLLAAYPKALFAGADAADPTPEHEERIHRLMETTRPDILLVAYGHPVQEEWINRHLPQFSTVKVAIGVGGAFDFAAGTAKRAPAFMRHMGLEWLWRLLREPKRFKRIWRATVVFTRKVRQQVAA